MLKNVNLFAFTINPVYISSINETLNTNMIWITITQHIHLNTGEILLTTDLYKYKLIKKLEDYDYNKKDGKETICKKTITKIYEKRDYQSSFQF